MRRSTVPTSSSAKVIATSSAAKRNRVSELGVDHVIDDRQQDFSKEIRRITAGRGVDVILDYIGAPYLHANMQSLAGWRARWWRSEL